MAKQPQSCAFRTSIGGQALIEGILMRGPEKQAIVVRDQGGNLVEKVEELRLIKDRHPILGWPLIRGTVNFLSSMVNGVKALMYSADFYPEEETTEPSKFEQWLDRTFSNKKLEGLIVGLSVLLGIGLSIFLFLVLPTFLISGLVKKRFKFIGRIALYVLITATIMVPILQIIHHSFPDIYDNMGVYLPLMVVNTLLLSKCRETAGNEKLGESFLDALASIVGFAIVICLVGAVRELLGSGTLWGLSIMTGLKIPAILLPFSGFLLIGMLAALRKWMVARLANMEKGGDEQ